jgi:hypothetical protein
MTPTGDVLGISASELARALADADAVVNLSAATVLREPYLQIPIRIYLETDPVLPQIEVAQGRTFTIDLLAAHTHHFTFGEKLGDADCLVPVERFDYRPTRQPVILDWWQPPAEPSQRFTTVANWRQTAKDVTWQGQRYFWSKDREFERFLDLPRISGRQLELALACDDETVLARLRAHGWEVSDALSLTRTMDAYREFLAGSRAEFTVAKDQNIRLRSGWFSDRSACYLASGRPVIAQDTGFGDVLPTGAGLFAFNTVDDVQAAMDAIDGDYAGQRRAARAIAEEYFGAERVLAALLEGCGLRG